jgi:hypothetical protein
MYKVISWLTPLYAGALKREGKEERKLKKEENKRKKKQE